MAVENVKVGQITYVPTIGGESWTCDPRVSGSSPGAGNLKKLLIWMKIHGLPQNHNKDTRVR